MNSSEFPSSGKMIMNFKKNDVMDCKITKKNRNTAHYILDFDGDLEVLLDK